MVMKIFMMMMVMMMIIHKRMLKALSSDWMVNDSSSRREESQHCSDQLEKALRLKSIISLSFLVMMVVPSIVYHIHVTILEVAVPESLLYIIYFLWALKSFEKSLFYL